MVMAAKTLISGDAIACCATYCNCCSALFGAVSKRWISISLAPKDFTLDGSLSVPQDLIQLRGVVLGAARGSNPTAQP